MADDRRLLILACSQRKRPDPGHLPAIERYDGPAFRVVRRYLRQCPAGASNLDVHILSAAYGLIPSTYAIVHYDQIMTPCRAAELHDQIRSRFLHLLGSGYRSLCLAMSQIYLLALDGWTVQVSSDAQLMVTEGSQGAKLAQLKRWLWQNTPDDTGSKQLETQRRGHALIRGVEIRMTPPQVLDVARQALAEGRGNPGNYQAWYVQVDKWRVAPKWLVSQLTELPVSACVTQETRRVLAQLGIEVTAV